MKTAHRKWSDDLCWLGVDEVRDLNLLMIYFNVLLCGPHGELSSLKTFFEQSQLYLLCFLFGAHLAGSGA